jgi:spermidine/putrescine transport system ATP-binding protein
MSPADSNILATAPGASLCPAVEIQNVARRFGEITALDQVNLSIAPGEFFSLLGPSGCGKTTLLRIIAGLDVPDHGVVRIGGRDAEALPAHRRPVNTVFQSYALFPHLNVWDNIAFGLRMKHVARPMLEERVQKAMALVQIEALRARKPSQLSGGQKQRVALARAVVNEPEVLLLDEPLGALDLKLRKQLQVELRSLQRRLGITFLYVTHDQDEALVLSDRIAVMQTGRIEQVGTPQLLYERPRTRFASQFLGSCSLFEARIVRRDSNGAVVETAAGTLRIVEAPPDRKRFTLAIRPEKVQLLPAGCQDAENQVRMRIAERTYAGAETHYELRAGPQCVRAEVMNERTGSRTFEPGEEVVACLAAEALIVLDD